MLLNDTVVGITRPTTRFEHSVGAMLLVRPGEQARAVADASGAAGWRFAV